MFKSQVLKRSISHLSKDEFKRTEQPQGQPKPLGNSYSWVLWGRLQKLS
ncbi:hypothetical protein IQ249_24805 [Lusitaniella coriacea LEGE 07157]|uniref:Uncharacterized protein n=1 Tax=Lusitaniella coriacea LEGE 07157 TaxID=945747 RepID=A0A8J7E3C0_9CYAN|nr:hypothetical protein [Lusitaniella coriacea]MBE9119081.1 hypothetical protein [Lusitaniella coriacea LEGE 07157]